MCGLGAWRQRAGPDSHRHTFLHSATLGRGSAEEGMMSPNAGRASRAKETSQSAKTEWWSLTFHLSCPSRAGMCGDRDGRVGVCGDRAGVCGEQGWRVWGQGWLVWGQG